MDRKTTAWSYTKIISHVAASYGFGSFDPREGGRFQEDSVKKQAAAVTSISHR